MDGASLASVNGVIAKFCAGVVAEPLCYFSEGDLQSLLFAQLTAEFNGMPETSVHRGPNSKGKYRTGLVHREYGAGGSRRIDLCVFSPEDIAKISGPDLMVRGEYLKPDFAIELGTEKTVDTAGHIAGDLKKLEKARTRGYLIHFFRDPTVADTGTPRREATEARVTQGFRAPSLAIKAESHVVYLCFVLRIRRSSKRIWGKCEFFGSGDRIFSKLNTAGVEAKVLDVLRRLTVLEADPKGASDPARVETIVEIGGDGGSIMMQGQRAANGAWQFRVTTNEAALLEMIDDDSDDDFRMSNAPQSFSPWGSWDSALEQLDRYPWPRLSPIEVHPDFADRVLDVVAAHEHGGPDRLAWWRGCLLRANW